MDGSVDRSLQSSSKSLQLGVPRGLARILLQRGAKRDIASWQIVLHCASSEEDLENTTE